MQEGWVGRILPFDLVQQSLLKTEYQKLKESENRLMEIGGELAELLDSFADDEKVSDAFNEDKDGFILAELAKEAKQIRADTKKGNAKCTAKGEAFDEDSYEAKILRADELLGEEKTLKKEVKAQDAALHLATKSTIEALSDEQVKKLLEQKWIAPLVTSLHKLPNEVIANLSGAVAALAEKYATTYKEVVEEMRKTEASLSSLIDELTGCDYDLKGLAEFQQLLKGE